MAKIAKQCSTCHGTGRLPAFASENTYTCTTCGGKGEEYEYVPDPVVREKQAPHTNSKKNSTTSDNWFWKLFQPAPRVKKSPTNKNKKKHAASKKKSSEKAVAAPEAVKKFAAVIGVISGVIIYQQTTDIIVAFLGSIALYLIVGAAIVIVNKILDVAVDAVKTLLVVSFWGAIIIAVILFLEHT